MRRRQRNTIFVFCIIGLFISSSIVPAFHIDFKHKINDFLENKVESYIERRINETDLTNQSWSYEDVINPDLGYDMNRMRMDDDYKERLRERYSDDYLMNHSDCTFDDYYAYSNRDDYRDHYQKMMEKYNLKPQSQSSEPTPKPDFENGETWYVDDELGEGPNNPSEDFTKIQDAINNANDGDTVYVYSGRYYENVVVNKSIILEGEDLKSIIDGNKSGHVVYIEADYVTIDGFTIMNGGGWRSGFGIIVRSYFTTICKNNIDNNSGDGILIQSSDNNIKGNSIIDNNGNGIHLEYSNNIVNDNTIIGNKGYGIYCSSLNNTITNNYFESGGIVIGLSLEGFVPWTILINVWTSQIIENNMANGKPIRYYKNTENINIPINTGQVIVANCTNFDIKNLNLSNVDVGVQLGFSSDISIEYNSIIENKGGIFLFNSSDNIIKKNKINNNDGCGINILYNSSNNTVKNNTISNKYYGIRMSWYSSNNNIKNNTIFDCKSYGIYLAVSSFNLIEYNDINNNFERGIFIIYSANNNISRNNLNSNTRGIDLDHSFNNTVKNNTINNGYHGIEIYSSVDNLIKNNSINESLFECINVRRSSYRNHILSNKISGSLRDGIYCGSSDYNLIEFNIINDNKRDGIRLDESSSNNTMYKNVINSNLNGIRLQPISYYNLISENQIYKNIKNGIVINGKFGNNIIQMNNFNENKNGIALYNSSNNKMEKNFCQFNQRGIYLEDANNNNLAGNICFKNNCGMELKNSTTNQINKSIISFNDLWGIYSDCSHMNFIYKNNFIDNNDQIEKKNVHYMGWQGDKNFFFRNYWSGRIIQSPLPYLIQFNRKSFDSPFPHIRFTFNWDWFPKTIPYNYNYDFSNN